ncbi:MAG TPA: class I SAM-dependent methyltransferase, partial [Candidatus Limnocylindrales bacterium]|nr:class I SAM-dependent methyltransferase [Candidatus Limnocylindrales bacterium]
MSDALHQPATEDGPDWAAYYRHTLGREPRPLFVKGMTALEAAGVAAGQAVEIGFGDGTETLTLLQAGWRVVAIDAAPDAAEVLRGRVDAARADRLEIRTESAETASLPPFDLLYAGYALSFIPPAAFRRFWRRVRAQLQPGGFLVVNVFGVRDTWAGDPDKTFVTRDEVFRMLQGLEVVSIDEEDQDGDS